MKMSIFDVSDKTVLVVGGNQGIGLAISRAFLDAGSAVTILSEVPDVGEVAERLSSEFGSPVGALHCDISDRDAVAESIGSLERLDVLVNNSGIAPPEGTAIEDASKNDAFARVFDVNVKGLYWVTQAALPLLGDGARIIFTASIWARGAAPGHSAYVSSKHAVLGLVRTLAMELGPRGINVNAVCPGTTRTPTSENWSEETLDAIASSMLIHNDALLEPEHLGGAYVFLASPAASEMTAQAIHVDRGQILA
jgi:NAD(P)-dependent dehydrogenase (short-subunit alcohol dehydrogenase family)